ncbi:MAG: lysoplasmalogenase [Clostridia bacterium]|nr:lysoplasmalogenase [Clostridia bacterium]
MPPLCIILAVLTVVFAVGCISFRRKGRAFEGMMCKFMASFGFISVAVVGYCLNPADTYYFCLVCFALMFGFFGDVLLGIKEVAPTFRGKLVPLGTLYFLIGHVFYLCAFITRSGFNLGALIFGLCGGIFALAVIKLLKMKVDNKLWIIMSVYYFALTYKAASAAVLAFGSGQAAYIIAFIGAVLFVISDTCLAFLYFTPVKRKNIWVTVELSTYYPAQILLAMSVALMK